MRSTLSFPKFLNIMNKHSIQLEQIFVRGNEILFLYVRYKINKFFVCIPEKYRMFTKKDTPNINIEYSEEANELTQNFLHLLVEKLNCTMIVVSNNYMFNTEQQAFKISGKMRLHHNNVGLVDLLENKSKSIARDLSLKFSETIEPPTQDADEEALHSDLEFVDHNGMIIPPDSNYSDMITDEIDEDEYDTREDTLVEEWELKNYPLNIGKVFRTVSITDFFEDQGIARVISEVELFNDEIYNIEQDTRKEKIDLISDLHDELHKKYTEAYHFFENKEKKMINDKNRLQVVISSLVFRGKLNDNSQQNVQDIIEKAKNEIENIDIQLLKIRDKYNEYFDQHLEHNEQQIRNFREPS